MPERFVWKSRQEIESMRRTNTVKFTEDEIQPYREAATHLSDQQGGTIVLSEGDLPKRVKTLMTYAAKEAGTPIRFSRVKDGATELHFVVLTPDEAKRQAERGIMMGEARRAKKNGTLPLEVPKNGKQKRGI